MTWMASRLQSLSQVRISVSVSVGEKVVGEIGLPGLVRQGCLEANVRAFGALLRLGLDEAGSYGEAGDGSSRGEDSVVASYMPCDGLWPRIQASGEEIGAWWQNRPTRPLTSRSATLGDASGGARTLRWLSRNSG